MKSLLTLYSCIFIILVINISSSIVLADRGGFSPQTEYVYESGQKAIIAWNGTDEILILSTDISSNQDTIVVELMPLPSNPSITKGEDKSFKKVTELINAYFTTIKPRYSFLRHLGLDSEDIPGQQKVTVTFQEHIGIHYITVVHAEEADDLTVWLRNFLETERYSTDLPTALDDLISFYMQKGMYFFAIDVIDASLPVQTVDTLKYEFDSSFLYYPLRISSLFKGNTDISLFMITSNELDTTSISELEFTKKAQFQIKKTCFPEIEENLAKLFSEDPHLYYFRFEGSLESFDDDIFAEFHTGPTTGVVTLSALVLGLGFFSAVLFFPIDKMGLLNVRKAKLSITRKLEIISLLLVLVGVYLFWSGLEHPWRLEEYGAKEEVLIPLSGLLESNFALNPLVLFSFLILILSYVYLLFVQRNSKASSIILITGAIFTILLTLTSYSNWLHNIGILQTLTGCLFIVLGALFSIHRIRLLPIHGINRTRGTQYETYIIRRLIIYVITLIIMVLIIFWIFRIAPWGYVTYLIFKT
ncbi:MAG: DUF2330 domain-containing protein [Candidatus Bathyarchaeota archaeon]|nr:DUF2330 domain-containing protein [Candidatus Bathyarchaeota archaeon]MDH5732628.1 DUF2330 domain-containing protein [Candidatus Bathyarchaeota archaeon]